MPCAFGTPGHMTKCFDCKSVIEVANVLDPTPHTKKQIVVYKPDKVEIRDLQFGNTDNWRQLPRCVGLSSYIIIQLTDDAQKQASWLRMAASLAVSQFVCVFKSVTTDNGGFAWLGEQLILLRGADINDAMYLCNLEYETKKTTRFTLVTDETTLKSLVACLVKDIMFQK